MYNEEANVERCVSAVVAVLEGLPAGHDLLVVDDGSRDATSSLLFSCASRYPRFSFIRHPSNRGYGQALHTAVLEAHRLGYENILFMDSDLTNDPALIPKFAGILAQGYDLVKASRYIPGGGMAGVPPSRQRVTRWGNRLARVLFRMGIHDCTNGFRAVRLAKLEGLETKESGFASILEELYHLKRVGVRATELPYTLTARKQDQGQSKFQYKPRVYWSYLRYALAAAFVNGSRR
jgi:dolichol-phosphate mannosyltransferase